MILAFALPLPRAVTGVWELVLFVALGALAGGKKVCLAKNLKNEECGSMSLGFAVTFAAMLRLGPLAAVLTSCASSLSSCIYPKLQKTHQLVFNVALSTTEALVGSIIFIAFNGRIEGHPIIKFVAVAASSLTYYAVNTFGVAKIISLCTGEGVMKTWKDNFLWTAPSYFASASVGALALLISENSAWAILLFVLPVAYLVYQSYVTYIGRAQEKQQHIEELQLNQEQLAELYLATIKSLALAIDAKDQYTHQHILRVQRYAVAIAIEMGLTGSELEAVNTGALLHDIGKLGVPEYVLLKPGRLTADEFDKIKKHPEIGAAILDPVEFPWPVLPVVRHHHEKWDGTGYPDGLSGEDIPLTARIMAVADVYDALTSSRSYRRAWTHERAVATIQKDAGTHFDPQVVEAFLKVIHVVVHQMAEEGAGPLAIAPVIPETESKASQAAHDISRTSAELWALYEVAESLSWSLGIHDTIDILSRRLETIFPGVACIFMLSKGDDDKLYSTSACGLNQEFLRTAQTIGEHSLSKRVLNDRQTYSGPYDSDDLMLASSDSAQWVELRSAIIVPILYESQSLGTMNVYHPEEGALTDYHRQLLEMIAERASLAIYHGLLYEKAQCDEFTDALTGLHNIRFLTEHVAAKCSERISEPFALICLDLDSFKPINDCFGHQKGDEVLRDIATLLTERLGSRGAVTRPGGDEFVIVLDGSNRGEATRVAQELQLAIEEHDSHLTHYKLGSLRLAVSSGVACFPEDGDNYANLISSADADMHRLKTERKLRSMAQGSDSPGVSESAA